MQEPSGLLALTGRVLAHSTDYMIESFWALLEIFGLVFKGSPFCIIRFGYFSANRYATDRVTGCSVLFILFGLSCVEFRRQESLLVFRSAISANDHNNNNYKRHSILRRELV